jgi:hypothetical protein
LLDLPVGLARGSGEQVMVVLGCQVGSERTQARQVQAPLIHDL